MTVREILTTDNAPRVKSVQSISNPEWGVWKFEFEGQPLPEGRSTHIISRSGFGNAQVLDDDEFKFYEVVEFKEEEQSDMLSLFNDIEVANSKRISPEDVEYCDSVYKEFSKCIMQLRGWYERFEQEEEKNPNDVYSFRNWWVDKGAVYDAAPERKYRQFHFSPLYGMERVAKLMRNACRSFEYEIVHYFNQKYNCRFESRNEMCKRLLTLRSEYSDRDTQVKYAGNSTPHYDAILDYIIAELGGSSFLEKADNIAIEEFRSGIGTYSGVLVKGSKISFPNYGYFTNWGRYEISGESMTQINRLLRVISLFDCGVIRDNILQGKSYIEVNPQGVDWGGVYDLLTIKAKTIRFFKNGKVEVSFIDATTANEFYRKYNLQPPQNR